MLLQEGPALDLPLLFAQVMMMVMCATIVAGGWRVRRLAVAANHAL